MASVEAPLEVADHVLERLGHATATWQGAKAAAEAAAKVWRGLVLEAVDAGAPQGKVAEVAGVSRARVHAIVVQESRA